MSHPPDGLRQALERIAANPLPDDWVAENRDDVSTPEDCTLHAYVRWAREALRAEPPTPSLALTRSRIDHWLRNRNLVFHMEGMNKSMGYAGTIEAIEALMDDLEEYADVPAAPRPSEPEGPWRYENTERYAVFSGPGISEMLISWTPRFAYAQAEALRDALNAVARRSGGRDAPSINANRIATILLEHRPATEYTGCACGSAFISPHEQHQADVLIREMAEGAGRDAEAPDGLRESARRLLDALDAEYGEVTMRPEIEALRAALAASGAEPPTLTPPQAQYLLQVIPKWFQEDESAAGTFTMLNAIAHGAAIRAKANAPFERGNP